MSRPKANDRNCHSKYTDAYKTSAKGQGDYPARISLVEDLLIHPDADIVDCGSISIRHMIGRSAWALLMDKETREAIRWLSKNDPMEREIRYAEELTKHLTLRYWWRCLFVRFDNSQTIRRLNNWLNPRH